MHRFILIWGFSSLPWQLCTKGVATRKATLTLQSPAAGCSGALPLAHLPRVSPEPWRWDQWLHLHLRPTSFNSSRSNPACTPALPGRCSPPGSPRSFAPNFFRPTRHKRRNPSACTCLSSCLFDRALEQASLNQKIFSVHRSPTSPPEPGDPPAPFCRDARCTAGPSASLAPPDPSSMARAVPLDQPGHRCPLPSPVTPFCLLALSPPASKEHLALGDTDATSTLARIISTKKYFCLFF